MGENMYTATQQRINFVLKSQGRICSLSHTHEKDACIKTVFSGI